MSFIGIPQPREEKKPSPRWSIQISRSNSTVSPPTPNRPGKLANLTRTASTTWGSIRRHLNPSKNRSTAQPAPNPQPAVPAHHIHIRQLEDVMYSPQHFWFQHSTGRIGVTSKGYRTRKTYPNVKDGYQPLGTIVDRHYPVAKIVCPRRDLVIINPISGAILCYNSKFSVTENLDDPNNWICQMISLSYDNESKELMTRAEYELFCALNS